MKKYIGFILVLLEMLSSCSTYTPAIGGKSSAIGVATTEYVEINGLKQYISIRSEDAGKPVLLFLHGGPGTAVMPLSRIYNKELEKHFVVVNWDQRGSGNSRISENEYESLTLDNYVEDCHTLIQYLCKTFNKKNVYLVGHSWGSLVGIEVAYRFPEVIAKYFSVGQVIDVSKSEKYAYQFILENEKNREDLDKVRAIGPPVGGWYNGGYDSFYYLRDLLLKNGGVVYKKSEMNGIVWQIATSPEYGFSSMPNWLFGSKNSLSKLWKNVVTKVNLFRDVSELKIPIVFMEGRHDYNTYYGLIEEYFNFLSADKKIYWFENSGHSPIYEESGRFDEIVIEEAR